MSTLGSTSAPSDGWEAWDGGTWNQHAIDLTATSDMLVTGVGLWIRGYNASCSFRGVVWNSTRNTVLGYSPSTTASGASGSVAASNEYTVDVNTPFEVADGTTVYVGLTRNYGGAMQFAWNSGGNHYDDNNGSSTPSGMSGESNHSGRTPHFYIIWQDPLPEVYLRRSGAWDKLTQAYVRRSGAWSSVGSDVYVRRSGAWVKA